MKNMAFLEQFRTLAATQRVNLDKLGLLSQARVTSQCAREHMAREGLAPDKTTPLCVAAAAVPVLQTLVYFFFLFPEIPSL